MEHLTVAVDVDGTLAEEHEELCRRIREWYGIEFYPEDIQSWNHDILDTGVEIGDVDARARDNEEFIRDLDPVPGAVSGMNSLKDSGHELLITTHRGEHTEAATTEWLNRHNIPYDRVVVDAPDVKTEVGADVLIDDRPRNIRLAAESDAHGILFLRHYNIGSIPSIERVLSVQERVGNTPSSLAANPHIQWAEISQLLTDLSTRPTSSDSE